MRLAHVVALAALAACSNEDSATREHPRPRATLTGPMVLGMRNCPSAVPGARTTVMPTPDGVDLLITSPDPAARARLVELAQLHSRQGNPEWFIPPHSGLHGGPGTIGHCPIIHADTIVTYAAFPDGVRIHVASRRGTGTRELQQATAARARALQPPSS